MNPAILAVLEELLATAGSQSAILQRLAQTLGSSLGNASGSAATGAAAGLGVVAKQAPILSVALAGISKAFNLLSSIVGGISSIFGSIVGAAVNLGENLYDFAKKAALGTAHMSDFLDVFKDLPLVGRVFHLFAEMVRYEEKLLVVYQNLSKVGASFGGELNNVAMYASRAYLSLDEFQKVVNANAESFALIGGGNVERGMESFVKAQNRLMNPDSQLGRNLLGLGLTADESAQYLTSMMKTQQKSLKDGTLSQEGLVAKTGAYIQELDLLSTITGKRREQIDKEVQEAENEQLLATFIDNLSPDEQAKAKMALAIAAPFGKAAVQEMGARLRGLDTPVSDAGANMAVFSNGMSLNGKSIRNMSGSMEDYAKRVLGYQVGIGQATGRMVNMVGPLGAAAGVLKDIPQEYVRLNRTFKEKGFEKTYQELMDKQKDAQKGSAGAFAATELKIKKFGTSILDMFFSFLQPIIPYLQQFTNFFIEFMTSHAPAIQAEIKKITDWFGTAFKEVRAAFNGPDGWKNGFKKLFDKAGEGVSNVWNVLKPGFVAAWEAMKPTIVEIFRGLFSAMWEAFKDFLFGSDADKIKEDEDKQAKIKLAIEKNNESIKKLNPETDKSTISTLRQYNIANQQIVDQLQKEIDELKNKHSASQTMQPSATEKSRATGTLGMTGKLFEDFGKGESVTLHGVESVVTPDQMRAISTGNQEGLVQSVQQLNNLTAQLLNYMKQTADNTKRTLDATKALNGNLFEMA